jgi:Flp pilus assembly protein CpaB
MRPNPLTALVRFLTTHRRFVATGAAMTCVFALAIIASGRDEDQVNVVTASARIEAGHMITESDLTTQTMPVAVVPDAALTSSEDAIGRMSAATLSRGSILTRDNLVAESGRATTPGHLILPVHLAQADLLKLIHPGDRIALLITDGATNQTSIAEDVLVVAIPEADPGGFMSASDPEYVLVDVPNETAAILASASVMSTITIALR